MITNYKFKHNEEQKVFFTSDTHFRHDREFIVGKRGYKNITEHDEQIINLWNSVVSPNDVVWHLGDHVVGAGSYSMEVFKNYFRRLNGQIWTIWGNHNAGAVQVYKEIVTSYGLPDTFEIYPLTWEEKVIFVGNSAAVIVNNQKFHLSHFAYHSWHHKEKDTINLCGHTHGNDIYSNINSKEKRLDIGIDNFKKPVSFDEVMHIMNKRK